MLLETCFICEVVKSDVGDVWHYVHVWIGRISILNYNFGFSWLAVQLQCLLKAVGRNSSELENCGGWKGCLKTSTIFLHKAVSAVMHYSSSAELTSEYYGWTHRKLSQQLVPVFDHPPAKVLLCLRKTSCILVCASCHLQFWKFWLCLLYSHTTVRSQNHRLTGGWKGSLETPSPLLRVGQLEHVDQHCVQLHVDYLQGWRLCSVSELPGPMVDDPHSDSVS